MECRGLLRDKRQKIRRRFCLATEVVIIIIAISGMKRGCNRSERGILSRVRIEAVGREAKGRRDCSREGSSRANGEGNMEGWARQVIPTGGPRRKVDVLS